jgi:hypothetical protein
MHLALLLTVLVFGAEPRAAAPVRDEAQDRSRKEAPAPAPAAKAKVGEADVRRLIKQLGAESYAQREAASKALLVLGSKALPALRAAETSLVPEVKARATRLVAMIQVEASRRKFEHLKRQVAAIRESRLSPLEKGRKLKELIPVGIPKQEMFRLLGKEPDNLVSGVVGDGESWWFYNYPDEGLRIVVYASPKGIVKVHSVGVFTIPKKR